MADKSPSMSQILLGICLGACVLIVPACAPATGSASAQSPQAVATCISPSLNPYLSHQPPNRVTNIFSNYKNGSISYESARQDAFSQLGINAKQWSAYKDVVIDEQRMVRVSITYLDPMLIQYVVLNYALVPPNNLMDQTWFTTQIQTAMESLSRRNEIMFLVTITSLFHENALNVYLPVESLKLVNASGTRVSRTHYDPVLGEWNNIAKGPVYGYVGYPVSVMLGDTCTGIMDLWTTSFTLDLKSSSSENNPFYNLSWNIIYQPLITLQENNNPAPTIDPSYDINRFGKSNSPPTPNWSPAVQVDDANSKRYWEEFGRYIWYEVILESGH